MQGGRWRRGTTVYMRITNLPGTTAVCWWHAQQSGVVHIDRVNATKTNAEPTCNKQKRKKSSLK